MQSIFVPIAGVATLAGVLLLAIKDIPARVRRILAGIVLSIVAVAGWSYWDLVREDTLDHEALLRERKHLCEGIATSIAYHQDHFLRGAKSSWAEHRAALSALGNEVRVAWRMCVREESPCGSMNSADVVSASGDQLDIVRGCFEEGPTPLVNARPLPKD